MMSNCLIMFLDQCCAAAVSGTFHFQLEPSTLTKIRVKCRTIQNFDACNLHLYAHSLREASKYEAQLIFYFYNFTVLFDLTY